MHFLSNIIQYSYSPDELRQCFCLKDLWDYGVTKKELESRISDFSNRFLSSNCALSNLKVITIGGIHIYCPSTLQDALCLRRTNQILRKAVRTPILNRDAEVKQLLQALSGETGCSIFRTDIKKFFESVRLTEIIAKLETDGLKNNCALTHLKNLNSHLIKQHSFSGLPRGLALSSTLGDYALDDFDRRMCSYDPVVYYTRYVDDICIIHFGDSSAIQSLVEKELPFGLQLNLDKTQTLTFPSSARLEYLGYQIALSRSPVVGVAENKVGKTKKRLVLSLRAFVHDRNFDLLLARLRFLSSRTRIRKVGRKVPVYTGYAHVYRLCDEKTISVQLRGLDQFLHGILNSRRFVLGRNVRALLTRQQQQQLRTISFEKQYASSLSFDVSGARIADIKKAWQYE